MESARRRSRWAAPEGSVQLVPSDLDICRLLVPGTAGRAPWGYTYLPAGYVPVLLDRGRKGTKHRLTKLRAKPHYVALPEQPLNNHRDLIYRIGRGGVAELQEDDVAAKFTSKPLPHELLACIIAASFEIASVSHKRPIEVVPPRDLSIRPDWLLFRYCGRLVFIEADMGTETNKPKRGAHATSSNIGNKFNRYLALLAGGRIKNPFFAFITCKGRRIEGWIETLMRVIDAGRFDHDSADHFGFMAVEYDRFLNTIPKLSSWAVTGPYRRPGRGPNALAGELFTPFHPTNQP